MSTVELEFDRTVPRPLVHKSAISEVFLTDSRQLSEREFACAVALPLMHSFYNDTTSGHHCLTLLVEVERQATILVTERYLGVPAGYRSLLHELAFEVGDLDALRVGRSATTAHLLIELLDRRETGGTVFTVSVATRLLVDGREAGAGVLGASVQPEESYRELRRGQRARRAMHFLGAGRAAPASPRGCGKRQRDNVVISKLERGGDGFAASVVVDQRHPSLFDHDYDHIPGMLLIEAATQMAVAATAQHRGASADALVPAALRAEFAQFAELELPLSCRARVSEVRDDATRVEVSLEQPDTAICTSVVDVAHAAGGGKELA